MPSSKAAEPVPAESGELPLSSSEPKLEALTGNDERLIAAMPYQPSVPCAACARGVDPLRAACISMTEGSVQYFCSRRCRETYVRSESAHQQKVARAPEAHSAPVPERVTRPATFEQVARRVAPAEPTTPIWPLLLASGFALLGALQSVLALRGLDRAAALGLFGVAALFSSRSRLTRERGSLFALLSAPLGVGLFGLASILSGDARASFGSARAHVYLWAGALGVLIMWLREHWLERERATHSALHTELLARLSPRVRLSSAPPSDLGSRGRETTQQVSERALERVQVGDELVIDSGSVVPVDGVVVSGFGTLLPYPRARLQVSRSRGQVVLAGALLTEGTLRLRATQVGDQRALFRVFTDPSDASETAGAHALRIAEQAERSEHALQFVLLVFVLSLLGSASLAIKLAGLAAAFSSVPLLALARGIRGAHRRVLVAASGHGVLYRSASSLERAGRVDTAVLRVEGPLVTRRYTLIKICSLSATHDARALLELALGAELANEAHGIAQAVREHASVLGVEAAPLRRLVHTRGRGVSGLTDGQGTLVFGSRAALLGAGVSVAVADREAQRAELLGQRVVFLALGGRARGLFVFAQAVQSEARVALQALFDLGLEVELVSGDHRPTVEAIARTLDITQVKAELSSEQRSDEVRRLRDGEAKVVAIGHIPEDQGLLAAADLSLSLDAAAPAGEHDVAYDITTASPDLREASAALVLARRLRRDVRVTTLASALLVAAALLTALGALPPLLCLCAALAVDWLCLGKPLSSSVDVGRPRALREDATPRGK